jgi:hypothetical protein
VRGIPVSVPGLARHAVPLSPSIAASLSWPFCGAEHAFSAEIADVGRTNPLPVVRYCFKSFTCNTYESARKCCKQKTYDLTKPFSCNTYKKRGVGSPIPELVTCHSTLATAVKFFVFKLLRTLLHFSASAQNSNRFFSIASALSAQNAGVGGVCPTSLLRYLLTWSRPETATPFPQRWGQLRKGRTVFRREDRVQR